MPDAPTSQSFPNILVLVVLYNRDFSQSQSICSLGEILKQTPELLTSCSLLVYDNSPQPQRDGSPAGLPIEYVHDPRNGGLARAYNFALERAESVRRTWLLLLDQDTSLTREFLLELLQAASNLESQREVAAIVPKLLVQGEIHSPAPSFISLLRRQFLRPARPMNQDVVGIHQQHLCAYNSGATLRVAAVRSIGGFPTEFWLDFLDHAIFHALYLSGYRTYVMRATLQHDFSHSEIERVPTWRLENALLARTRYVLRRGTFWDRQLYRLWLLRDARKLRQTDKGGRIWKQTALQALRLQVPSEHKEMAEAGKR